jgi:hypothetical protein
MTIETPIGTTLISLTGYPDCDGGCTFYSSYSAFDAVAQAADDQPTGTTHCSNNLHFGGLTTKTISLYKCLEHYTTNVDHCEIDESSPVTGWSLNSVSIYEDDDSYLYSYVANIPEMVDYSYVFVATYTVDGVTYSDRCQTVKQLKTILTGSNLLSETGWPDCHGGCTYHTDYSTFSAAKDATNDVQSRYFNG